MKKNCHNLLLGFFVLCQLLLIENVKAQNCWSPLGLGARIRSSIGSGGVNAIITYQGTLIAGGRFDTIGEVAANNIGSWNGYLWAPLANGINSNYGQVNALEIYNGDLYAAGQFDAAGGTAAYNIAKWNGTSWASVDSGLTQLLHSTINALVVYNGALYVAGTFDTIGGILVHNIAKWDGTRWSDVGGGVRHGHDVINSLFVSNNRLYVGGMFDSAGDISALNIAIWNDTTWSTLGTGIGTKTDGLMFGMTNNICAITDYQGELYAAGMNLDTTPGTHLNNIAKWNGTAWSDVAGGVNNDIYTLFVYNETLLVGGNFWAAGGLPADNIAQWNGTSWSVFGGGIAGEISVSNIDTFSGKLYVGGYFKYIDSLKVNGIAEYNCPNGINSILQITNLHIFPNPTTGIFNISIDNIQAKSTIQIYNLLGQQILQTNLNSNKTELNLNGQAAGTYLYRITGENGENLATGKFVLQ